MGTRLTHVALHVDAIEECVDFYRRYCELDVVDDQVRGGRRVVLMSEPGRGDQFVLQLLAGGMDGEAEPDSDRHLGFAVDDKAGVDQRAQMARDEGLLVWDAFEGPSPVGYVCGIKDPNGNTVEISCGHLVKSEIQ